MKAYLKTAGHGKGLDLASGKCTKPLISAIKAFQTANKLTADGLYGTQTHSAMKNQKTPLQKTLKKDAEKNIKRQSSQIDKRQQQYDDMWQEYNDLKMAGVEPSDGLFADDNEERMFKLKKDLEGLSNQIQSLKVARGDQQAGLDSVTKKKK